MTGDGSNRSNSLYSAAICRQSVSAAVAAYRDALALEPAEPVRRHITGQIAALGAAPTPTQET